MFYGWNGFVGESKVQYSVLSALITRYFDLHSVTCIMMYLFRAFKLKCVVLVYLIKMKG
jgi:hypothetical protein